MSSTLVHVVSLFALAAVNAPAADQPIFRELTEQGVKMSDGTMVKLPPPVLPDGLDAAGQRTALGKADARTRVEDLIKKSYNQPSVVKVRTIRAAEGERPAIRAVDLWFVVHGDWNTLTSKEFLDSLAKSGKEAQGGVVTKSGVLTDKEMAKRKLSAVTYDERYQQRFVYSTFALFERVQLSATRRAELVRGDGVILAAAKIDPCFDSDAEYPNQWRALLRNDQAEIVPGPPNPYHNGGGYAKITRLAEPADAALIECHLAYEEPCGWFDGANLVKAKASLIVREQVRTLRRKLAQASGK